ncbi:hypothetical protein HDU99_002829 [Rhizoclosmatium hyalinum]|nr:hypothetical protein HDU99_002829 [Rhizoclosmatium hyalinum]
MPLKAEIPPLIIPLLHMIPSPPPLPHLLETICHLLQNKLPQTTQTSLLMLASTAFHVLGPSFLFQLSPTPEDYKRATLLIHLTCTDLRVLLDTNNPSTSVTVSHITFITDALTAIVQTESLDFPGDLLISVHHALAETFVAVLAHLVDLYEGWREAGSSGVFGDDKEGGGVVKAAVEGLGVWLAEDTEASSIAEVKAGLGVLVHCAKRGNGCEDLGGVFMNVTGAGDECVERFLECGGGDLVAGWVLYGSGEERRVGVCCVLNLVVSGVGVGRLVEGGNVRDVSTRLLECLVKDGGDLRVKVTEDVVVHVMNACCLALFVVRDCIDLSEGLRNEVVACSVQALYHTRSLTSSWEDVKELWFLSVNALSEIVARGEDIRVLLGRIDEFIGLVKACGEIAEQAGDGDEAQFDRESVLGFLKAFTSQ